MGMFSPKVLRGRPPRAIILPIRRLWYFWILGDAHFFAERYNEAVVEYNKARAQSPHFLPARLGLAACHSLLGREKDAADTGMKVRDTDPKFSLDFLEMGLRYKEQAYKERLISALRKAGLTACFKWFR